MRIAVVGTGYVGLVAGAGFSDFGNDVVCADVDAGKIARLERGEVPIYEPGLDDLIERNKKAGRIRFTTDVAASFKDADVVFIAVGTRPAARPTCPRCTRWPSSSARPSTATRSSSPRAPCPSAPPTRSARSSRA